MGEAFGGALGGITRRGADKSGRADIGGWPRPDLCVQGYGAARRDPVQDFEPDARHNRTVRAGHADQHGDGGGLVGGVDHEIAEAAALEFVGAVYDGKPFRGDARFDLNHAAGLVV